MPCSLHPLFLSDYTLSSDQELPLNTVKNFCNCSEAHEVVYIHVPQVDVENLRSLQCSLIHRGATKNVCPVTNRRNFHDWRCLSKSLPASFLRVACSSVRTFLLVNLESLSIFKSPLLYQVRCIVSMTLFTFPKCTAELVLFWIASKGWKIESI